MRKVVLYTLTSLDGAVDHPGQYFPATDPTESGAPLFDHVMVDIETRTIREQDAVLLGRRMYDEWSSYWPKSDEQPFADFINNVKKYVATSTPLTELWGDAEAVTGPIAEFVRDLKARPGGDIGVHGSIELAQSLAHRGTRRRAAAGGRPGPAARRSSTVRAPGRGAQAGAAERHAHAQRRGLARLPGRLSAATSYK